MTGAHSKSPARAGRTTGKVLPFRRSSVKPRRRRRNPWLALLRPLATAVMLVGLPTAVLVWALTSPRFMLRELSIEGTERVPGRWIEARLAPFLGRNLIELSLASVAGAVEPHPWIEAADLSKELPGRLRIKIRERRPAALVKKGSRFFYADAGGRPIAPLRDPEAARVQGYLVVTGEAERPGDVFRALEIERELRRAQPAWGSGLERVEVLDEEDFRVHTSALPFALVVRPGDLGSKSSKLAAMLPALTRRLGGLESVDLRYSKRIIVNPASGRSGGPLENSEER